MTVSSPPPPPGQKKKLSPLAWVGIGCAVILFICALGAGACAYWAKGKWDKFAKNPGFNTMELMLKGNPDVEIVSSDEKAGTITVKDKKSGEVVTYTAGKDGKFSVTTKDGTTNIDMSGGPNGGSINVSGDKGDTQIQYGANAVKNPPSWVPEYPGGTVQGTLDSTTNGTRSLAYTVSTSDGVDKVVAFYNEKLEGEGLQVTKTTFGSGGSVTGKSDDGKRTMNVMITGSDSGATAIVTVEDKN